MKFTSGQCVVPQTVGTCTDGETTKQMGELSAEATFDAYGVVVALECTTMGRTSLDDYTTQSLDVVREFAVASELQTGAASANPSLADASELVGAPLDVVAALACLDQHAATELSGRLAFIHVSPQLATHLFAASAIRLDGRRFLTAYGNVVVISSGYDGRAPGSPSVAPSDGDPTWLYATGEVYAETGMREVIQAVERGQNTLQTIAEDAAIAVFDPCFNVAIETDVTFCEPVVS